MTTERKVNLGDIEVGDVVYVRMIVDDIAGSTLHVSSYRTKESVLVSISDIVRVEARPLKVRDKVNWTGTNVKAGIILAIHEDEAWVAWKSGRCCTVPLAELELAA